MSHCSCLSVARILFCSNEQPGPLFDVIQPWHSRS